MPHASSVEPLSQHVKPSIVESEVRGVAVHRERWSCTDLLSRHIMSLPLHDEAVQSAVDLYLVLKLLALGDLIKLQLLYLLFAISNLLLELG